MLKPYIRGIWTLLLTTSCYYSATAQSLVPQDPTPAATREQATVGTKKKAEKTIHLLAIGNSFSQDAIENYLHELAKNTGKKIVIANLYIPGAPLSLHLKNIQTDSAVYKYTKILENGKQEITPKISLSVALKDEQWDYISFQQASSLSGIYGTYEESLPALYDSVASKLGGTASQFILHQTWAYQQNSTHAGFSKYDRQQAKMYAAISETSQKVYAWNKFQKFVPAGTAIQNARTSYIGDAYTRDGYHLNLNYGRFTAACAWYEVLFQENVLENSYFPKNVSFREAEIAKEAAHKAVLQPYTVSKVH